MAPDEQSNEITETSHALLAKKKKDQPVETLEGFEDESHLMKLMSQPLQAFGKYNFQQISY